MLGAGASVLWPGEPARTLGSTRTVSGAGTAQWKEAQCAGSVILVLSLLLQVRRTIPMLLPCSVCICPSCVQHDNGCYH